MGHESPFFAVRDLRSMGQIDRMLVKQTLEIASKFPNIFSYSDVLSMDYDIVQWIYTEAKSQ